MAQSSFGFFYMYTLRRNIVISGKKCCFSVVCGCFKEKDFVNSGIFPVRTLLKGTAFLIQSYNYQNI